MPNDKVAIILNFDKKFIGWGETLIRSLAVNAPDEKVIVYTVNVPDKARNDLKMLHNNLSLHNQWMPFLTEKFKRHYMINRKVDIFLKAVNNYPAKYYVLLDADMILIQPIARLIKECIHYDTGVIYRDYEKQYHMKLNASLIAINKERDGEILLKKWKKVMSSNIYLKTIDGKLNIINLLFNKKDNYSPPVRVRKGSWFWDQLTLYYALRESGVKFNNLPISRYLNSVFDETAVFWSAHSGNKKIALEKFRTKVKEMEKAFQGK